MGVIVLALVITGHQDDYSVPFWVILLCATAPAAATLAAIAYGVISLF